MMWDNRSTLQRGRRYDIAEWREICRATSENAVSASLSATA